MAALSRALLIFAVAQLTVASRTRGAGSAGGRHFLESGSDLRPELVADLLTKVEDEWRSQAASFAACNQTEGVPQQGVPCATSSFAFSSSCAKVVGSVVKGSSGDRATVIDYMAEVCEEPSLQGWKREHCQSFQHALGAFMSADDNDNREHMDVAGLCRDLWQSFSKEAVAEHKLELDREEKAREEAAKKAAEEAEAEKKRQEEAAKLAAEEAKQRAEEEAKRQAEEAERKAEEAKHQEEERRRREEEEAARKAEEAKHQAEEAATRMKTKQEEAAREAELAKRKYQEAQEAAQKIRRYHAQANSTNASAVANFTEQANTTNASAVANLAEQVAPINHTNATVAETNGTKH